MSCYSGGPAETEYQGATTHATTDANPTIARRERREPGGTEALRCLGATVIARGKRPDCSDSLRDNVAV